MRPAFGININRSGSVTDRATLKSLSRIQICAWQHLLKCTHTAIMPGVPRSKGCENCRRRKKGCDLKRPCGRCIHLGLQCDFGRGFKFIDETQPEKHKPTSSRKTHDHHPVTTYKHAEVSSGTLENAALHDLDKSAHQANAIGTFWDAYATSSYGTRATTMTSQKLLKDVMHESSDPALRSALLSLAMGRLSRISGHEDARRQAATQYSVSIAEIRKAISHPQRKFDDGLLAAVMVLGTYEVSVPMFAPLGIPWLSSDLHRFTKEANIELQPG